MNADSTRRFNRTFRIQLAEEATLLIRVVSSVVAQRIKLVVSAKVLCVVERSSVAANSCANSVFV
jgi:hypothetical protein